MSVLGVWWISNARLDNLYSIFWVYWQTKEHSTSGPLYLPNMPRLPKVELIFPSPSLEKDEAMSVSTLTYGKMAGLAE